MAHIDRDKLLKDISESVVFSGRSGIPSAEVRGANKVIDRIKAAPAADVAEVKHGYWVEWWDDNYLSYCHKCSECGSYPLTKEETMHDEVLSAYCPYCGAKMDGERRETE